LISSPETAYSWLIVAVHHGSNYKDTQVIVKQFLCVAPNKLDWLLKVKKQYVSNY